MAFSIGAISPFSSTKATIRSSLKYHTPYVHRDIHAPLLKAFDETTIEIPILPSGADLAPSIIVPCVQ